MNFTVVLALIRTGVPVFGLRAIRLSVERVGRESAGGCSLREDDTGTPGV